MSRRTHDGANEAVPQGAGHGHDPPHAAAIDIGATMHMAAVPPDGDPEPVRSFGTFTGDLHRLADWFERCGVRTVAMESTSVYWSRTDRLFRGPAARITVSGQHVRVALTGHDGPDDPHARDGVTP